MDKNILQLFNYESYFSKTLETYRNQYV